MVLKEIIVRWLCDECGKPFETRMDESAKLPETVYECAIEGLQGGMTSCEDNLHYCRWCTRALEESLP